jgi:hypothetical protein
VKRLRLVLVITSALLCQAALACDERTGHNCVYIQFPTAEELKKRQQDDLRRREEARREQQRIDDELARRGWPKSREQEIRRFFELQKTAAAVGPKAGAGAALRDDAEDAQTRWLKKQLDGQGHAAAGASGPQQKPSPGKKEEAKREAFSEAIIACTRPDAAGQFRCLTPVNVVHGHPKDKVWRTPEALVAWASASCPGARRLASTTHLVWGCGFGATHNANSLDRSAGVDVKGRTTYYCTPKEVSCRRTSP